jgi:predicted AAA+ superfamily ATPase
LLSSELATYIAGRYISIEVSTLSFAEHLAFAQAANPAGGTDIGEEFDRYLRRGGFPGLFAANLSEDQHARAVSDIYASALIRDTITRRSIRNVDLLERVALFALENVGRPFSARSVSRFIKAESRNASVETVVGYLGALSDAFVLNRCRSYDIRGKALMKVHEKYFAGDHGLVWALHGYQDRLLPGVLENIVWAELRRRGYQVRVGKDGTQAVDFVADKAGERLYIQVTTTLAGSEAQRQREVSPLTAIADAYPKVVVSLDRFAGGNDNGVRHYYLPEFLLADFY